MRTIVRAAMMMVTVQLSVLALAMHAVAPAAAQTPEAFFKGKTVTLLVGFGPGGANDIWARLVAKYLPRHWPGSPTIVVQNQPGAGGLTLMGQLAALSPKDGTVFALVNRGIPLEPLLGGQGARFDPRKLTWLGSPERDAAICAALKSAKVQRIENLYHTELVVGATGSGADSAVYPEFLAALLGMKFKTVKGYKGSNDILLAMERGEVQGVCMSYESLMRQPIARDGHVNVLFQAALQADPRLPDVPVGLSLARNEEERQALQLFLARVALGRPFVAPGGLPADRAVAMRAAFAATTADPDFVAEVEKQGLGVDPIAGETLAGLIDDAYKTPPAVVTRTIKALGR